MRNKLIIENRSTLTDADTLDLVKLVIQGGRISNNNKQYCYATLITREDRQYIVSTDLNKSSDRFVVTDYEN